MKRVITIKGNDGETTIEVNAKVMTKCHTKLETERVVNKVARNLFLAVTEESVPYSNFGVHNTTVSV